MSCNSRCVRFVDAPATIHLMVRWSSAYKQARCGQIWLQYARDTDRFQRRIKQVEKILDPILQREYRENIYQDRFKNFRIRFRKRRRRRVRRRRRRNRHRINRNRYRCASCNL